MSKKIGMFLMIFLVIWSVLLLDATKNRKPPRPAVRPQTSTQVRPEPSSPETVPPETTLPAAVPTENPGLTQVEESLNLHTMDQTAVTYLVRADGAGDSQSADLALLASQKQMNPIAAFWVLVSEGLYERVDDQPGLPSISLSEIPVQTVKQYDYTDAGAKQLLTDLLVLAGEMENGIAQAVMGENDTVSQVFLSEQDDCRYAYFAYTTDRSTQILCFYLRSDTRGERICDVEFQFLHMTNSAAPEQGNRQAVALAAATELLMTGTARAGMGENAASYKAGGFTAEAERIFFTAEGEEGSLTNYRLRE